MNNVQLRVGDLLYAAFKRWKMILALGLLGFICGFALSGVSYLQGNYTSYEISCSIAITSQSSTGAFTNNSSYLSTNDFHLAEDMVDAAKQIHADGVEIVAVSLGGDGSFVVCDDGIFRARVPKIDAVNTVGCGDSMIAGFALGLSEGLSVEETLKKASAISAAAALREETGFFVKEDMEKIYPQVEIEKIG